MMWIAGVGVVAVDYSPCSTVTPKTLENDVCMISKTDDVKYKAIFEAVKYGNRIINTHVSGDKAADQLMDVIEAASKAGGWTPEQVRARYHSMDHCTLDPRPDQVQRGKPLGIMWACAPSTLARADRLADAYGEEQVMRWSVPAASVIRAGARISGHGEGVRGDSYFTNLEALLTRKDVKGKVWNANEAIDRKDVLRMYTIWAADYVARTDRLGSLEPGKFADLVVLDQDYMTIPADQFHTLHPLLTVVGGKVVFHKEGDAWASSIQ
jgi:predicted amidohydrolase YtcJ